MERYSDRKSPSTLSISSKRADVQVACGRAMKACAKGLSTSATIIAEPTHNPLFGV
jgi:hypothetical protein